MRQEDSGPPSDCSGYGSSLYSYNKGDKLPQYRAVESSQIEGVQTILVKLKYMPNGGNSSPGNDSIHYSVTRNDVTVKLDILENKTFVDFVYHSENSRTFASSSSDDISSDAVPTKVILQNGSSTQHYAGYTFVKDKDSDVNPLITAASKTELDHDVSETEEEKSYMFYEAGMTKQSSTTRQNQVDAKYYYRISDSRAKTQCGRKSKGITNIEVLGAYLQLILCTLVQKGVFPPPPHHWKRVLWPLQHRFMMSQRRPVPLYPIDRNDQSRQNPLSPLSSLFTYSEWPNDSPISPRELASAGLQRINTGYDDLEVGCLTCGLRLRPEDLNGRDPCTVHRQRFPHCPVASQLTTTQEAEEHSGTTTPAAEEHNGTTTPAAEEHNGRIIQDGYIGSAINIAPDPVTSSQIVSTDSVVYSRGSEEDNSTVQSFDNDGYTVHSDNSQGAQASVTNIPTSYPPLNPDRRTPASRRESFRNWSGRIRDIDGMVAAGLCSTGEEDIVRCFHCDIGLAEWDAGDDPWQEHARHSPVCPYIREHMGEAYIIRTQRQWSQIYTPKHPDMNQLSKRLESFNSSWPRNYVIQTPRQLSEAGFYYTGETDTVRCHYCDGGLREWELEDDPWTEHARWFPFCKFVLKTKGRNFVQDSARPEDDEEFPNNPTSVRAPPSMTHTPSFVEECRRKELENPMLSAAALSVRELGYKKRAIKKALNIYIANTGKREFKACDLLDVLFDLEENEYTSACDENGASADSSTDEFHLSPKAMAKENDYMKGKLQCVVCQKQERCMLFVPCGHRITCETCAKCQRACPSCGHEVTSCVKSYLV